MIVTYVRLPRREHFVCSNTDPIGASSPMLFYVFPLLAQIVIIVYVLMAV